MHRCGYPRSVCSDKHRIWYPQRTVCYPEMEQAAADRRYSALHEDLPFHDGDFKHWSKHASLDTPYHYQDGVNIWVADADLNPDDNFLGATVPPDATEGGDDGNQA